MSICTLLNVFVHRHLRVQSTRKHFACVIVVIWKNSVTAALLFIETYSGFAFQLADISRYYSARITQDNHHCTKAPRLGLRSTRGERN